MVTKATPKFHTAPVARRSSRLSEISVIAEAMGLPLLPWQAQAVRVGTEMVKGQFVYDTVVITVPRQSGKTGALRPVVADRMLALPDQYGVYIAQTRTLGTSRLRQLGKAVVSSGLDPGCKLTLGAGNERLRFSNGSMIEVQPPSETGSHGESIDVAVIDEAWAVDEIVLDGLLPAMSARANSQLWMVSTAGSLQRSLMLNAFCDRGRNGDDPGMAYIEYSMPEDAHPYDRSRWHEWMPALGLLTVEAKIVSDMKKLDAGKFRRAYGNIPTATEGEAIPADWWQDSAAAVSVPSGVTVAVDATARGASVAVAFRTEDGWHVDPWAWREGSSADWVIQTVEELARYRPELLVFDPSSLAGPAAAGLQETADRWGVPLRKFTLRDRALGDQWFYEALRDSKVTHSSLPALEAAVEGAVTVLAGDLWRFDRKASLVDVSPLVACSMAVYAAQELEVLAPEVAIW